MFNDINHQLDEARQGVFRYQKLNTMQIELNKQKSTLEQKEIELKVLLEKEEFDVMKLEGKGLTHIFHSVIGNLEERLQKEQQEVLAAHLKYDQAVRELDYIKNELTQISEERYRYKTAEHNYKELYERKKQMLLETNSITANEILSLTEQMNEEKRMMKEIHEAIGAGLEVMNHLNQAIDSLDSAEGWGTWDLLGGGFLSDMAKHGHIDDAKEEVEQTQRALSRFRTELADIRINSDITIETDGFAKFADFFFDGLIADWCMQSRINESQESVRNAQSQVQEVINKLNSMEFQLKARVEQLEKQIKLLIEQA